MGFNYSQYMSLPVPVVGGEPGPNYATDVNNSLTIIDQHTHNPGSGVQITPTGLDINADLTFLDNNATNLRSTRFTPQGSPIAGSLDQGCLYVVTKSSNSELYYNDSSGHQVQITSGGTVNATSSGITNGTVSASFNASNQLNVAFISSGDPTAVICGPLILEDTGSDTFQLTVNAPTLSSSTGITLPLPATTSTKFLQIDTSGNITSSVPVSGGITASNIANGTITGTQIGTQALFPSNLPGVNVVQSPALSGGVTGTTPTLVAGSAVSITSSGYRPFLFYFGAYGGSATISISSSGSDPNFIITSYLIIRDIVTGNTIFGTPVVSGNQVDSSGAPIYGPACLSFMLAQPYTTFGTPITKQYEVLIYSGDGFTTITLSNCRFTIIEI
jgi:hypothetical protein